jgi:hypothetical protein
MDVEPKDRCSLVEPGLHAELQREHTGGHMSLDKCSHIGNGRQEDRMYMERHDNHMKE